MTQRGAAIIRCLLTVCLASDATKPHLISILQDDLGFYDSGIQNPKAAAWSGNITSLARDGIVLQRHYAHFHCSPSRRAFLTGRLPVYHGEELSKSDGDDIDLRMTWISQKLKHQGYKTYWFGKMHVGFKSFQHLGWNKGFDVNVNSLDTGGAYSGPARHVRWEDDHPIWEDYQFIRKPDGCGVANLAGHCRVSQLHGIQLTSGSVYKILDGTKAEDAAECCSACHTQDECTHWVYWPNSSTSSRSNSSCNLMTGGGVHKRDSAVHTENPVAAPTSGAKSSDSERCVAEYSTDTWGRLAVDAIRDHDVDKPMFMHLCFQAVHEPYHEVPGDPTGNTYRGMLWRSDVYIGQLVSALRSKRMWENTLIVYASDNGGIVDGNNYPLRGSKGSNFEGGVRVAAFVSGGFVPKTLRGSNSSVVSHLVDWYATFSSLAGADPRDDPPVAALPVDLLDPFKNIYGNDSFPAVNGVNLWPMLSQPDSHNELDAAHKYLVLSKQAIVAGRFKLVVSQPHTCTEKAHRSNGWRLPDGRWEASNDDPCNIQDAERGESAFARAHKGLVCLYDVHADPGERKNIAPDHPERVAELWAALNKTMAGARDCAGNDGPVKGPDGSCSPPELLGVCNKTCAETRWMAYGAIDGPICGVPGCDSNVLLRHSDAVRRCVTDARTAGHNLPLLQCLRQGSEGTFFQKSAEGSNGA